MKAEVENKIENTTINGLFVGRDLYIQDLKKTGFVVTNNANIRPVSYFIGRDSELEELRQRIEEDRKHVLVSGMGGIGKTQICRNLFCKYVDKHSKGEHVPFQHIGFIEYTGDMSNDLQNCLDYERQENPEANKQAAWLTLFALASDGKLLLFIDDVDRPMEKDPSLKLLNYIPGPVVLTSRQKSFGKEFETYHIGFLSMEQCRKIYEKILYEGSEGILNVNSEELSDLEYIIEKLAGKHTITIEFLAHLACTKQWTVNRLKEELKQKGFQLDFYKEKHINIQEEYEKLYDLSELSGAEQNILEAFSIFPYIPLSAETCNQWLLSDAGLSEDNDVLMGLYQKGWLQLREKKSYAMHPVFAQFIYEKCKPSAEKHAGLIRACRDCMKIPDDNFLLECQKCLPFVENIIEKISMEQSMERVKLINMFAQLLRCSGEYRKAEEWFRKSLEICEKLSEEDNCDIADIYDNLGLVCSLRNKIKEAKELYEKSVSIREKVLGENHKDTITSYSSLASMYMHLRKYKKAEQLLKKELSICEKAYEENEPQIAIIYNELGALYRWQKMYNKAKEQFQKSLSIHEKIFGENHLLTAANYRNMAGIYLKTHKYRKAEELYKKSLSIFRKSYWKGSSGYSCRL